MNTAPLDAMSRHPRRLVEVDGATLSYREAGSGEPIVLLHGISSSSASWIPFFEAMRGYRLIAWDAPGYGKSSALSASRPRAADYAQRLARFLEALSLPRITLVGHSLGALMAGAFAASKPERVEALVLASPASGYGTATGEARRNMIEGRLDLLRRLGPQGLAEERGPRLLSPDASAEAVEWVGSGMRELNPAGYVQAVHMLAAGRRYHSETARAGWGAWIRTRECRNQNPVPYHLATPHPREVAAAIGTAHPPAHPHIDFAEKKVAATERRPAEALETAAGIKIGRSGRI